MRSSRPILLVEDDNVDVMTLKRAFKDLGVTNEMVHSVNGENALAYLKDENNTEPSIIILDLNMPRMNGIELLETIKANKELRRIPVVVLTTSNNEKDVIESFELSVAGYMVKPADYQKFVEAVKVINQYWSLSELPEEVQVYGK